MNCKYCHKECTSIGNFNHCVPCQTVYSHGEISITCKIKGKTWIAFIRDDETIIGNAWHPSLIKLPCRTNITPSNIIDKIKLYVLFS